MLSTPSCVRLSDKIVSEDAVCCHVYDGTGKPYSSRALAPPEYDLYEIGVPDVPESFDSSRRGCEKSTAPCLLRGKQSPLIKTSAGMEGGFKPLNASRAMRRDKYGRSTEPSLTESEPSVQSTWRAMLDRTARA
eukprot:CAMPEP_0179459972 /NCGR_PEP_ID=MMETSP0799-20121207/43167_1 /TAXON_ID=46947 /ORGANISM="Geminigera cryophila, Strain CCMP2564" /LENGTH=133 /DNA_ID=CAMNT_0021262047 /DNA_START=955 /DNA_END=1352 /DNA_ORIENTATION=+